MELLRVMGLMYKYPSGSNLSGNHSRSQCRNNNLIVTISTVQRQRGQYSAQDCVRRNTYHNEQKNLFVMFMVLANVQT